MNDYGIEITTVELDEQIEIRMQGEIVLPIYLHQEQCIKTVNNAYPDHIIAGLHFQQAKKDFVFIMWILKREY